MLRRAFRGTKSVARHKPFGALIFDNRLNDEGAPERHRAQNWMALRASISHSFMALTRRFLALTRDHESCRCD